ncbi:ADP-ribosylglycohydrolase family protein [Zalerion maritima]|uniref:ADP-ribosylhydrolase ARH3 n=1 Tax=Zalerion maritima TaxID=339359 RepID=A0AAD5RZU1_9PEZI|nr:ADP-ribosylglycohydrolase family protein [Zalerion maritima]
MAAPAILNPAPMTLPSPITPTQSRTLGALLGVHAGDSLGATLEFEPHHRIKTKYPRGLHSIIGGGPFSWPAGHATDDTDMTRGVLLAYQTYHQNRTRKPSPVPEGENNVALFSAQNFLEWYQGRNWPGRNPGTEPLDIGTATRIGLQKFAKTGDPERAGAGRGSMGNGSLMRCIPSALFHQDLCAMERETMRISSITHDDYGCQVACAAYNAMVAALVSGASSEYAVKAGEAAAVRLENGERHGKVYKAIQEGKSWSLKELAEWGPPTPPHGSREKPKTFAGYVMETLSIAVAALLDGRPFQDVVIDVVRVGMDTDTNGAVAGGLVGARDGVEMIPRVWREKLQFGEEFVRVGMKTLELMRM